MSLLMFELAPDGVLILTDTLATSPDGSPHMFMSKCHTHPHLGLAIATTGLGNLHDAWMSVVRQKMVCRDIEMLDRHAPAILRGLWADLTEKDGPMPGTATVYHFGLSERLGEYVGYVYRSTNHFASEGLPYAFGVKPVPAEAFEAPANLDEWIALASTVRQQQDALVLGERIHIGGSLVLNVLSDGGMAAREIHRFPDFDEHWEAMCAAL